MSSKRSAAVTVLVAVVLCATLHWAVARQPSKPTIVEIGIRQSGGYTWNGLNVNDAALVERIKTAASSDPQPEVHVMPKRLSTYREVAYVMTLCQRYGLNNLGLIGNEQAPSGPDR